MQENHLNRLHPLAFVLVLALLLPGLAACGQRGPLYLPSDRNEVRTDEQIKQDELVREENKRNRESNRR